jgi:hypothetical protein
LKKLNVKFENTEARITKNKPKEEVQSEHEEVMKQKLWANAAIAKPRVKEPEWKS